MLDDVSDPIQRSEAIRAMVESIALIPDNIRREEYVRYCAEIMHVSQDMLNNEVIRTRSGQRGGYEARDFVQRQQMQASREQAQTILPNTPLPHDANTHSGGSVGSSVETLEREISKYLLRYGHLYFSVLDEETKEFYDYNVAEHIFTELDTDDIRLTLPAYSKIYDEYHAEYDRNGVGAEVDVSRFVNHFDPDVSRVAVDLLTSDDNYVISRIWEQKDIHNESVQEQLADGVPSVVSIYKWRVLDGRIADLKLKLRDPNLSEDEMSEIIAQLTRFQAVRTAIATVVKRLI